MKISIELNDQELDIVLAGLEGLKERLTVGGYVAEIVPVQNLVTRIIGSIEQNETGSSCCGGCK